MMNRNGYFTVLPLMVLVLVSTVLAAQGKYFYNNDDEDESPESNVWQIREDRNDRLRGLHQKFDQLEHRTIDQEDEDGATTFDSSKSKHGQPEMGYSPKSLFLSQNQILTNHNKFNSFTHQQSFDTDSHSKNRNQRLHNNQPLVVVHKYPSNVNHHHGQESSWRPGGTELKFAPPQLKNSFHFPAGESPLPWQQNRRQVDEDSESEEKMEDSMRRHLQLAQNPSQVVLRNAARQQHQQQEEQESNEMDDHQQVTSWAKSVEFNGRVMSQLQPKQDSRDSRTGTGHQHQVRAGHGQSPFARQLVKTFVEASRRRQLQNLIQNPETIWAGLGSSRRRENHWPNEFGRRMGASFSHFVEQNPSQVSHLREPLPSQFHSEPLFIVSRSPRRHKWL